MAELALKTSFSAIEAPSRHSYTGDIRQKIDLRHRRRRQVRSLPSGTPPIGFIVATTTTATTKRLPKTMGIAEFAENESLKLKNLKNSPQYS